MFDDLLNMNEQEYEDYLTLVDNWIEKLIRHQIWDRPKIDDYKSWKKNFKGKKIQGIATRLADNLIFYSQEDIKSIIWWCFDEFMRSTCIQNYSKEDFQKDLLLGQAGPQVIQDKWVHLKNDVMNSTIICPAVTDSAKASSYSIVRQLADGHVSESMIFNKPHEIEPLLETGKYKYLLLVDDVIGTGNQACENWVDTQDVDYLCRKSLLETALQNDVQGVWLVFMASEQGMKKIKEETDLTIIVGEILLSESNVSESKFWGTNGDAIIKMLKDYVNPKGLKIEGYEGLSWCVAYHHDIPDVSSPLYHFENENWHPFIRRAKGENL